jgi:hypothetical protein
MARACADVSIRKAKLCLCLQAALLLAATAPTAFAGVVQNCGDGGPGSGSLRDVIASAAPGETIDLSQLSAKCGMAEAVITLSNGEIAISQDDLKLQGPLAGSVTIEPAEGKQNRILNHTGSGMLVLNNLSLANGRVQGNLGDANGGCVNSRGSVFLSHSWVSGCMVTGAHVLGGGVFAANDVVLLKSALSGNEAIAATAKGLGGGVGVGKNLLVLYSTVTGNHANSGGGIASDWGVAGNTISIYNSTIDSNTASSCGAADVSGSAITVANSTISDNSATHDGGMCLYGQAAILNSTIAFNAPTYDSGGLRMEGIGSLNLQSSIIAVNGSGSGVPDLYVGSNITASGADNLITSASGNLSAGVIKLTSSPKLDPSLRYNGGLTRTHAVLRGSPVIANGNNSGIFWTDQRGKGYARTTGTSAATDIGAFQFDSIFFDDFDG